MSSKFDVIKSVPTKALALLKHQQLLIKFILNVKRKGVIVFHSVGSGKTLTSLFMAHSLLGRYPEKRVTVVTPTSLVGNYNKEIAKSGLDFNGKINVISYGTFINGLGTGKHNCSDRILVIDEAHAFNDLSSKRAQAMHRCCQVAFKVILLTATPVKNRPDELAQLVSFVSGDRYKKSKIQDFLIEYQKRASPKRKDEIIKKLLHCKVSFFKNVDKTNYPSVTEQIERFRMPIGYYHDYLDIQNGLGAHNFKNDKDLTAFINGVRRAINKLGVVSPKIDWAVRKICSDTKDNKKVLLYSSFKDSGINIIKKLLDKKGIRFSEVSGDLNKVERDQNVRDYNAGKVKVMLITASGSEGLDLKETRTVIILEPYWNPARIQQIIGRAARFESHSGLPPAERNVTVHHLLMSKPRLLPAVYFDKQPSADDLLDQMTKTKQKVLVDFYKDLERVSIENHKSCFM